VVAAGRAAAVAPREPSLERAGTPAAEAAAQRAVSVAALAAVVRAAVPAVVLAAVVRAAVPAVVLAAVVRAVVPAVALAAVVPVAARRGPAAGLAALVAQQAANAPDGRWLITQRWAPEKPEAGATRRRHPSDTSPDADCNRSVTARCRRAHVRDK
jgi:hypothetical protein